MLQAAPRSRHVLWTAAVVSLTSGLWLIDAWLGRDVRPWAIEATSFCFVIALGVTYVSGWLLAAIWSRAPRRRMLFRGVATTLVLLIAIAILEAPVPFGLVDYGEIWSRVSGEWDGPSSGFVGDLELSFRRPPNQRWSGRPRSDMASAWNLRIRAPHRLTFTTDSRGYRNTCEIQQADIALIGDSYIEGAYVSDEETCAVALERLCGRPVVNLGLSGYGTLQQLEVLQRHALPLRPRMVAWFFFEGNDLYDDDAFESAMAYLAEHGTYGEARVWDFDWEEFQNTSFTFNSFRLLRRLADPIVPNNVAKFGWFCDSDGQLHRQLFYGDASMEWDAYERERFEKTKAAFRRGQQICQERGVRMVLFFVPFKFRVYDGYCTYPQESPCREWRPWDLPKRFAEFCRDANIDFVDLTQPMRRAAAAGRVLYAPEDSHWSQDGHEFVAQLVREQWDRHGLAEP